MYGFDDISEKPLSGFPLNKCSMISNPRFACSSMYCMILKYPVSCILLKYFLLESKSNELAAVNKMIRILINAYPERAAIYLLVLHERLISTVLYLTAFLGSIVSFLFALAQALRQ